ncbi:unnamed protein product [Candida verbasci]|uniref:tRNA pseudouridine(32) synthase n=1 Tax=Candida verbasci TaxID=1227364 RepID=A0A9W4U1Z6_9ASCO|nr:unnamed protein product [Candida verbasci]
MNESKGIKRPFSSTKAVRDKSGFKLRQQDIDKSIKTAFELNGANNPDIVQGKTIEEEEMEGTKWIIDGRLRRVLPYYFTYMTYCKQRWLDRKLIDVFIDEFRDRTPEQYRKAIELGQVCINSKPADLNSVLKNGDLITHRSFRREPGVTSTPIKIVYENDEIIAIDKPSGIPVHPTGRYRYNTITKVMQYEMGKTVHPCNRLDRLTSGLMFLGKTSKGANEFMKQIRDRNVHKEYISRVKGEFPLEDITVDKPLFTVSPKHTLNIIDEKNGKEAITEFKRISYDPITNTSIVKCHPLTGRTHQIRVHLQYLGHPIANDPIYSNSFIWGENNSNDNETIIANLDKIGKTKAASSWFNKEENGERLMEEICPITGLQLYSDPGPNDLDLWLHAYCYENKNGDWSYKTSFPEWSIEHARKFMQLAIKEAEKCDETQTQFNVGCVLVNNGEIISTGYSRELSGNTHAEQNALAKYFTKTGKNEVPLGTELYTTMEPCSYRLSGNLPCVNRIIEQYPNIKTCYVGVVEPDVFVKNNSSYQLLKDKNIEYIHIPGYEDICIKIAKKGHEKIK